MADELVYLSGSDDRAPRTDRTSVKLFLLGVPEHVERTIGDLHVKQFSDRGLWSRPLLFPEIQQAFLLNPGEVMRVYKRYLTR